MSKVLFNKEGVPLIAYGTKTFMTTTGAPAQPPINPKAGSKQTEIAEDKTSVGSNTIVSWGSNNDFPKTANDIIKSIGVLNTGLKFTRNFTMGQGIFPCTVTGYDEYGNETLEVINDPKIINFCQGRMVRRYLEKILRDYLKYGVGNAELIPSADGKKIVGISTLNALYSRYTVAKNGVIENVAVSSKFPDSPGEGEFELRPLLDEYDPLSDLFAKAEKGILRKSSIIYAVRDSWSNSDYYPEPLWHSAYLAGWIEIARNVPAFLKKAYQNQITWKWHVQIPYAFWDKKFPKTDFAEIKDRQNAIEQYMDDIEKNLCGPDNADKPIFTFFEINPQSGKAEEQWIITPLDNKYKEGDKLITSAAANSEIMFAIMINPNVLGAGMPGGTYAGNQGGSNIREAFLVNIANAWIDRQNILDPIEAMLEFNGIKDVQLRFRNTILTTLDSGAGSKKVLN